MAGSARAQTSVAQEVAALSAAQQAKLGPELQAFVVDREQDVAATVSLGLDGRAHETTGAEAAAYVLIRGDATDRELSALGVRVMTRTPSLTTAFVPLASLAKLAALESVEAIEVPHPLDKHLNVSALDIEAPTMWNKSGTPPVYNGYSGKNIVIGIIDTGLDLTHADFKTSQGKTRVKYYWDQTLLGSPPLGFNYGTEFTAAQIDLNPASSLDIDGHGTHIAGIAASNGRATGGTLPAYRYIGIAPEANLVIVKSILTDLSVIDGVNYVFQKAAALGEDAVILLSVGSERGPHDGGADLDRSLSAMTGPGKLIVASVGNYNRLGVHSRVTLASNGASTTLTPVIPTYAPGDGEYLDVQAWHLSTALFQVKVTSPSGIQSAWIQPGGTSGTVATADGAYSLANDQKTAPTGRKEIDLYVWYQGGTTPKPKTGTWKIDVQRLSGSTTGQLDAWIASWRFGSGNVSPSFSTFVDSTVTVASPASGDSVIAVTAFTTRDTWTNFLGQTSFYVDHPVIQDYYDPASLGPRLDGVQRPDVAAPGEGIISSLSISASGTAGNLKADDGVHWIMRGTSMAAAHVAGGLGLLLQKYPHLSPSAARNLVRARVRTDSKTGSVPNMRWGYGKFDLGSPTVDAGPTPRGVLFKLAPAWPSPSRGTVYFDFEISPSDIAQANQGGVNVLIFDTRGRLVSSIAGSLEPGPQRMVWNGLSEAGFPVPAGVYLGRLEVGNKSAITKFVRLAP